MLDSILEYSVYEILKKNVPIELIGIHEKIVVKNKTKHFDKCLWSVDFTVRTTVDDMFPTLIEAKGIVDDNFRYKLQLLDQYNPDQVDRLIVVSSDVTTLPPIIRKACSCYSLDYFSRQFRSIVYGIDL